MQPLKNITIPITAGLGISIPFVKHLPDNKKMKKPIIVIPIKIYSILNTDIFIPPSFKNFANTDHTYLVKISITEPSILLLLSIFYFSKSFLATPLIYSIAPKAASSLAKLDTLQALIFTSSDVMIASACNSDSSSLIIRYNVFSASTQA